jgi:steroid delta-isomerase-like uncharacterized protein
MHEQQNEAALAAARDEWNAGNLEGYLRLYAPDAVVHGYAGVEPGLAGIRQFYEAFWTGFPASHLEFEDVFAAGDRVACRYVLRGTHAGAFQGIPATDRSVTMPGITILRFAAGRCVERWSQADFLGLLGQLGVLPVGG